MSKLLTKNLIILFLGLFIISTPLHVINADDIKFTPSVPLPNAPSGTIRDDSLAKYFQAIYRYAMGIVGILATVVMMWGGIRWITAGGSPEAISEAKAWITASLTGLLLMLGTYTILYLVNSDLVNFRPIELKKVEDAKIEATTNHPDQICKCIAVGINKSTLCPNGWKHYSPGPPPMCGFKCNKFKGSIYYKCCCNN